FAQFSTASSFETHRFAMLLRTGLISYQTLMVRSRALRGVSNHEASGEATRESALPPRFPLHREFGLKAGEVAVDRGNGEHAALVPVLQQAIPRGDVTVDHDLVPFFGVADIVDRHVIMLTPEKRHRIEGLALPQHVARRGLSLALRHHPVFDPDVFLRMRIGPARDVAGRIDSGNAGFEKLIHL